MQPVRAIRNKRLFAFYYQSNSSVSVRLFIQIQANKRKQYMLEFVQLVDGTRTKVKYLFV